MKRFMLVMFILCATMVSAQTVSTANQDAPLPVAVETFRTFFTAAQILVPGSFTTEIAASSTAAFAMTALPAGAKGVIVSTDVAVNYGNASCTTGTNWPTIAAGGSLDLGLTPYDVTPTIYFSQRATGATATIRLLPYK